MATSKAVLHEDDKIQNLVNHWVEKSKTANTSLSEICRELKIPRSTIERWKTELPQQLQYFFAIDNAVHAASLNVGEKA